MQAQANSAIGELVPGLHGAGVGVMASRFADPDQHRGIVGDGSDVFGSRNQALASHRPEQRWGKAGTQKLFFLRVNQIRKCFDIDGPHLVRKFRRRTLGQKAAASQLKENYRQ